MERGCQPPDPILRLDDSLLFNGIDVALFVELMKDSYLCELLLFVSSLGGFSCSRLEIHRLLGAGWVSLSACSSRAD
ncbi:unnamed protein product [Arctogadus glacialis]